MTKANAYTILSILAATYLTALVMDHHNIEPLLGCRYTLYEYIPGMPNPCD